MAGSLENQVIVQARRDKSEMTRGEDAPVVERPWVSHLEEVVTLEVALYGLAILSGLVMRLLLLDLRPLSVEEGALASESYRIWQGQPSDALQQGPLTAFGTALMLAMFAGGDGAARLLPALAGTVLVAAPYLLRGPLGRTAAILAAFGIAVSPLLLFASRDVGSGVVPITLGVLVWWALEPGIMRVGRWRAGTAALLLSGLLACGVEGLTVAAGLAVAAIASSPRIGALLHELRDAAAAPVWRRSAALFVGGALAVGTGLGTNLKGVQWVGVDAWANWLGSFRLGAPKESILVMLGLYELPVMLLAIPQLLKTIFRPTRTDSFLALWAMLLLLQGMLQGAGPVSRVVLPLVPLYFMAARLAARTLPEAQEGGRGWGWTAGSLAVAAPVAVAIVGLTGLSHLSGPMPELVEPYLYSEVLLIGIAGLVVGLLVDGKGRRALAWYAAAILGLGFLWHGTVSLNYRLDTLSREPVVGTQVSTFLRDAATDAAYFSRYFDAPVTVDPQLRAATEWYLRRARVVQYSADASTGISFGLASSPQDGLKPGSERRPGLVAPTVDPRDSSWQGIWRWLVTRDGLVRPNQRDIIVRAPAGDW